MRTLTLICVLGTLALAAFAADAKSAAADDRNAMVIIFKDGHQETVVMADVARIEFKTSVARASTGVPVLGKNHFVGKWRVGDGTGSDFYITLSADGEARKSIGSVRGTWEVVGNEAQIRWDDGWHDIIRPVGNKHEKVAFEPGKSFSDPPANVTSATIKEAKPI